MKATRMILTVLIAALTVTAYGGNALTKVHRIIIPRVEFEEASIDSVLAWLRIKARELDPAAEGVNFFLKQAPEPTAPSRTARVTMEMRNVPLESLVRYVCQASGMKCRFDDNAVVIADPSIPIGKMETRFYHVNSTVLGIKPTKRVVGDPFR